VRVHARGEAGAVPFTTGVLELADELLLLGVDTDRWLPGRDRNRDRVVDVRKLSVAVGMLLTLQRLTRRLQTEPEAALEQPRDDILARRVTGLKAPGPGSANSLTSTAARARDRRGCQPRPTLGGPPAASDQTPAPACAPHPRYGPDQPGAVPGHRALPTPYKPYSAPARATAAIPPRPKIRASAAANRRR